MKYINIQQFCFCKMTYKVISLFSGIGGLDAGFGGKVVVHKDSITEINWISKRKEHNFVELHRLPFEIVFQNDISKHAKNILQLGYDVNHQLVKCEEFGIPQRRWRVIILGVRKDINIKITVPFLIANICCCPVKRYFEHLKEPKETTDPAQMIFSKAKELQNGQGQVEVDLQSFAPTMRAEHHGNIEFRRKMNGINKENHLQQRRLTVREASLLQTFPPDCILTDDKKSMAAYKPIGNAVPPLLSYIIANKVLDILQNFESS